MRIIDTKGAVSKDPYTEDFEFVDEDSFAPSRLERGEGRVVGSDIAGFCTVSKPINSNSVILVLTEDEANHIALAVPSLRKSIREEVERHREDMKRNLQDGWIFEMADAYESEGEA